MSERMARINVPPRSRHRRRLPRAPGRSVRATRSSTPLTNRPDSSRAVAARDLDRPRRAPRAPACPARAISSATASAQHRAVGGGEPVERPVLRPPPQRRVDGGAAPRAARDHVVDQLALVVAEQPLLGRDRASQVRGERVAGEVGLVGDAERQLARRAARARGRRAAGVTVAAAARAAGRAIRTAASAASTPRCRARRRCAPRPAPRRRPRARRSAPARRCRAPPRSRPCVRLVRDQPEVLGLAADHARRSATHRVVAPRAARAARSRRAAAARSCPAPTYTSTSPRRRARRAQRGRARRPPGART